jgi:hypothetical protein
VSRFLEVIREYSAFVLGEKVNRLRISGPLASASGRDQVLTVTELGDLSQVSVHLVAFSVS